jgi:hypothetical protein
MGDDIQHILGELENTGERAINMGDDIQHILGEIENTGERVVGIAPTASARGLFPEEYFEFTRVFDEPGRVAVDVTGGTAYSFSQYNSRRHGPVIIWRANLTPGSWGWYAGRLPLYELEAAARTEPVAILDNPEMIPYQLVRQDTVPDDLLFPLTELVQSLSDGGEKTDE